MILLAMLMFASSPWVLILGNGLVGFFSGAFNPTRQALMNQLLPEDLLPQANALFSSSFAFLHAAGPVLGAACYGSMQRLTPILLFDLATYVLGIGILSGLLRLEAGSAAASGGAEQGFFEELAAGVSLLGQYSDFRWIIARCVVASSALGIVLPLLLPMTTEVLRLPEAYYGFLLGVFGLGGAIGSMVTPRYLRSFSVEGVLRGCLVGEGVSLLFWALNTTPWVSFTLAFLYGTFLFSRITSQLNFVSFRLPGAFNARANALLDLAMVVPNVLGAGVVAVVGGGFGTGVLLEATAVLLCVGVAVSCLLEPRRRNADGL
jgi:predicted MFS family arabinose efflux permease